jgi:hypothetical protein
LTVYDNFGGNDNHMLDISQPPDMGSHPLMMNFDFMSPMDSGKESNKILITLEPQVQEVKEKYPNGSKYQGQKKGGLRNGKGKFIH